MGKRKAEMSEEEVGPLVYLSGLYVNSTYCSIREYNPETLLCRGHDAPLCE